MLWYLRAKMGVFDQIWWARFWRPHTREFDYFIKSLPSLFSRFFFSVLGVFLSGFFLYLFLFVVARARAVSLFLFFFRRRQRTRVEKIWRCFGRWWWKSCETSERMRWCTKKFGVLLPPESWTDAFLFVSTLNKACVGKKRKERERIDFRWRWWWEILM